MGSSISFSLDTREFEAAMREYQEVTRKDEVEVVNRTAGDVALRAAQFTAKSSAAKINAAMWRNSGDGRPTVYKLVNRAWSSGGKGFAGDKMSVLAKKFIKLRMTSIAFLRSGWKECAIDFGKGYSVEPGKRNYGSRLGKGVLAVEGINPTAFLYYFTPAKQASGKNGSAIIRIAQEALQKAINFKIGDMRKYIERKLEQRARQFSAR